MVAAIHFFCGHLKYPNCNNGVYQQKEILDIELDELWKHLMNISKWKYQRKKNNIIIQVQFIEGRKDIEQHESKFWDPRRL